MLQLDNLRVFLPGSKGEVPILRGISFALEAGGSFGLAGESGCGKSMTALAILGLLPRGARTEGSIHLDGQSLLDMPEEQLCHVRGRQISMIFQEPMTALNPVKTIGEQIDEGLRLHLDLSPTEREARILDLLDRVGLPAPRFSPDLYPHQLSGGQRQRVLIAAALAPEPKLLIADEPTTALDVTIQKQILQLLIEITEERQMALLIISHDLGVIAAMTNQMAVMYAGRIVEQAKTSDFFTRLAHPYSRALLGALPAAGRIGRKLEAIDGMVPSPAALPQGCSFAPRCAFAKEDCARAEPPLEDGIACYHPLLGIGS